MNRTTFKLALIAYAAVLLYAGWMPLHLNLSAAHISHEFHAAISHSPQEMLQNFHTHDGQKNLLLFMPLGGLFVAAFRGRRAIIILLAAALAMAISAMIEAGQLVVIDRVCDTRDLAMNTLGGLIGALAAGVAIKPFQSMALRIAPRLHNRHAMLAAVSLALVLLASVAWRIRIHAGPVAHSAAWFTFSPPPQHSLYTWLLRQGGSFAALTLLLAAGLARRKIRPIHGLAAAAIATNLAAVLEVLHLLIPGERVNLGAVIVAAAASICAAMAAPVLHRRSITLREGVLLCAAGLFVIFGCLSWDSSESTPWPLWGLYSHEYAWAYYSCLRRWALMAALSVMLAFYASLKSSAQMRYRMVFGMCAASFCAAALEIVKSIAAPRGGSISHFLEHAMAAVAGALLFALIWNILDRRRYHDRRTTSRGPDRRMIFPKTSRIEQGCRGCKG